MKPVFRPTTLAPSDTLAVIFRRTKTSNVQHYKLLFPKHSSFTFPLQFLSEQKPIIYSLPHPSYSYLLIYLFLNRYIATQLRTKRHYFFRCIFVRILYKYSTHTEVRTETRLAQCCAMCIRIKVTKFNSALSLSDSACGRGTFRQFKATSAHS
jgi:hypothetical protein